MWHPETSQGREAQKIAPWAIQYLEGKGFDIGCGSEKVATWAVGVDPNGKSDIQADGCDLSDHADRTVDFVFSSHFIEHCQDYEAALAEWWRIIKVGGHLVLYWPHPDHYPRIGQYGANKDHKHDILPAEMHAAMQRVARSSGQGWVQVEDETRSGGNEYSQFAVFRKLADKECIYRPFVRRPKDRPRAVIIRYGAIGDIISATTVIPGLRSDGYHITFACSRQGRELLQNDPRIDEFIGYPNPDAFWACDAMIAERFDKVINLSHTFEGQVLALPNSPAAKWPASARRKFMAVDYLMLMANIAEQDHIGGPLFYPTIAEVSRAQSGHSGRRVLAWALKGSGPQKWYPWVPQVLTRLLLAEPDLDVVLLAGPEIRELADKIILRVRQFAGPEAADRIVNGAGKLSVRQSLATICEADVAVGVETGLMWAVATGPKPKVLICSHSDPLQFSSWVNTQTLHSNPKCGPCLILINDWSQCDRDTETLAARCAVNLTPETVLTAIRSGLETATRNQERAA